MNQTVSLLAPDNPPSEVIGTATLSGLPDERFPGDLAQLAPVLTVQGRTFQYIGVFGLGDLSPQGYVEVTPMVVEGSFQP